MSADVASTSAGTGQSPADAQRAQALEGYKKALKNHNDLSENLKKTRLGVRDLEKQFSDTEASITALQSIGQICAELLKQLDEDRFIVKASSGPRYISNARKGIPLHKLKPGARVALDLTTMCIMRVLPREVDVAVYRMSEPSNEEAVSFASVGGLGSTVETLLQTIALPLQNPELFTRLGIKPPKGVLLYGPPGTGKTLLAKALAAHLQCKFLHVVASAIVDKYIGESSRLVREMFAYANQQKDGCVIFLDEIDALAARRLSSGTSADREIARTLMNLLAVLDGFDPTSNVKVVMATNRPDTLDPALLRPGRIDRKIEVPLPNLEARIEILKIHARPVAKSEELDFDRIAALTEDASAADLRMVVIEAGMLAIRNDKDYINNEYFVQGARKVMEQKKLESKSEYTYSGK